VQGGGCVTRDTMRSLARLLCASRSSIRLLVLLSSCTIILLCFRFAGKSYSINIGRALLGLPMPTTSAHGELSTHIEASWINGKSKEGFLSVENILKDPRTTEDSAHLERLGQTPKPETSNFVIKKFKNKHKLWKPKVKSNIEAAKENHNADFDSVMIYNSHFTPHITKDLYKPGYMIANSDACNDKHENVLVTILVISAPDHFKQREAIRNSWGSTKDNKEVVFSFLVGLSDNTSVAEAVTEESDKNNDVIVNNIDDLYQNLSLKTISAFAWLKQFCPKSEFLLKVDDDMFVQIERLLELIRELLHKNSEPRLILGNISRGWKPVRNPESKYLITEAQYPGENYPDFATGPSYLVSKQAVMEIIPLAMEQRYIHLEDVFLTGVVAESLGISRNNVEQFKNNANRVPARFMGCTLLHTITIHKVGPEEQAELTQLARNPECGKRKKPNSFIKSKQTKKALTNNYILNKHDKI